MAIRRDQVDRLLEQWAEQRPDLDASPMGVIGRISRLSRRLDVRLDEVFSRFGLAGGTFDVLATLRRAGPPHRLSPTELFRALMLSSGTMTNRLDRLEERGLIARYPAPNDRRGLEVALTDRGHALIEEAVAAHLANEQRLLSGLSGRDRDELARLLRKLLLSLEQPAVD